MATEAARLQRKGIHRKERQKQTEKNTLTGKKKKNILDTHRPSHGRR
jgi:hypothetical protein